MLRGNPRHGSEDFAFFRRRKERSIVLILWIMCYLIEQRAVFLGQKPLGMFFPLGNIDIPFLKLARFLILRTKEGAGGGDFI
jgi:hypothetical protein